MENKRILAENLQFCEYFNKWLAENLKQALCAEEVYLINGEFMIIEDYEITESYYGHQLIQPIGSKISMLDGLRIILNYIEKQKASVIYHPSYSEVLTTLTYDEIHKCFIAYEVLCTHASDITDNMATTYLKHVASYHLWDYDTFMDIIDEEYDCVYNK